MPKRRLLWQLYPSFLVITLLTVVGLGWLATHWFNQLAQQNVWRELERRATFVETQLTEGRNSSPVPHLSPKVNAGARSPARG